MSEPQQTHIYKVMFHNQGQVYEVYAHAIYQSDLYGFIEVEDYLFGTRAQVVPPSRTTATFLPSHLARSDDSGQTPPAEDGVLGTFRHPSPPSASRRSSNDASAAADPAE